MGMFNEIDFEVNWKRANKLLAIYKKEIIEALMEDRGFDLEDATKYADNYLKMDYKTNDLNSFSVKLIYYIAKYQGILELANTFDC